MADGGNGSEGDGKARQGDKRGEPLLCHECPTRMTMANKLTRADSQRKGRQSPAPGRAGLVHSLLRN